MIRTADDVWKNQTNRKDFCEACNGVMKKIEEASEEGHRRALFDPRPTEYYNSVKDEFAKFGYKFEPIGVCGGVLQDGEYICW